MALNKNNIVPNYLVHYSAKLCKNSVTKLFKIKLRRTFTYPVGWLILILCMLTDTISCREPVYLCTMISLIQMEYFQDDVYPETTVTWEAALTSQEWLSGEDGVQSSITLRPHDMEPCEEENTFTLYIIIIL